MSRQKKIQGAAAENSADRAFSVHLAWITLGSLILRLTVCRELAFCNGGLNAIFYPSAATDMATYMKLAFAPWSEVFYYQPWYYSVFLPLAGWFGRGVWPVIFAQALLGAAAVWLTGAAGKILFGRTGGYTAAVLAALSAPLCLYVPYHLIATVQSFHFVLLLFCALEAVRRRKFLWWGASGVLLGIAILTRGNAWFFLPVLLAAPFLAGMGRRRGAVAAGILLVLTLAVQVPFCWHNSSRLGRFSGPSTAASPVLALGNSPEAPPGGRGFGLPAGPMEYPEAYSIMMERERQGTSVPKQIFAWALSEPGAFLELQFRKALLFWEAGEIPNNVSILEAETQSFCLRWLTLPGWILLALGAAGALVLWPRLWREQRANAWLLYGMLLAGWAGVSAFYVLSRFRAPMLPCIAVFAGGWVALLRRRRDPRRDAFLLAGALAAGLWLVLSAGTFYREFCEARIMALVRPQGTEIVFPDGERCRFDHGPRSFGGWRLTELKPGTEVGKRLPATPEGVRMDWTVFSAAQGEIGLTASDGRREQFVLEPGENHLKFSCPAGEGVCLWRIGSVSPDVFGAWDGHRRYGRSLLNGKVLAGEWVMRWK